MPIVPGMPRPTPEQLASLRGFERVAFALADTMNRRPALKRAGHAFLRSVGATWVHVCSRNLQTVWGLEDLRALRPERGLIIAANHTSFFDCYVIASVLLRNTDWVERMYFPVKSTYFYERLDGVLVNALMSAMAMYPPVMREPHQRELNKHSVDYLVYVLGQRGTVVGIHPEGTRNKTGDPYTLLPAQPGIGQIAYHARAEVLPVFVLGLSNDFARQVRSNFARDPAKRGAPITMVFGRPVALDAFYGQAPRLRTYMGIARHVRDEITKLGADERRRRVAAGMPVDGPSGG